MNKFIALLFACALAVSARATSYQISPSDSDLGDLDHQDAYTWGISNSSLKNELLTVNPSYTIQITSVTLTIKNLYNWDASDTQNELYIHLLDTPKTGVQDIIDDPTDNGDNQGYRSDYFDTPGSSPDAQHNIVDGSYMAYGYKNTATSNRHGNLAPVETKSGATNIFLTQYHDTNGPTREDQFVFNFTQAEINTLASYILDGNSGNSGYADFGLGFDPDCHFYNDGVCLTINTAMIITPPPSQGVPDAGSTLSLFGFGLLVVAGGRRFFRA